MIDETEFYKEFDGSFWNKQKGSLVPFNNSELPKNKKDFLSKLYTDIASFSYSPAGPRDYVILNKHNFVARIVPVFNFRDNSVFFYCLKKLEDYNAVNRVEGTFGGWRLGNKLREKEDGEIEELDYIASNSYDRYAWVKNWRDYQKKAYQYSLTDEYSYFILFDIANFYDSINLSLLENKIRYCVTNESNFIVELLFHFLKNWNKKLEGYFPKAVGLPQDEIGDCSRILANFYLQDYDRLMKSLCHENNSLYLRYADDQIIFSKNEYDAKKILFEASKELSKIGLSVNSGKVKLFNSRELFDNYWAFEIFALLEDYEDSTNINNAARMYFDFEKRKIEFRAYSVLRRLLNIDFRKLELPIRHKLLARLLNEDILPHLEFWSLKRVFAKIPDDEKEKFFSSLDRLIPLVNFNSYHYNLLRFYRNYRKDFDCSIIENRIIELKL